jgi:prepilin-type N-terminal cleavage/methylation domain-containing protein
MTRRNNLTKRGFTVLEVTIAVSVIAILAGLLIYGIGHLTASGKANQTRIVLQDAQGMLQEFSTAAGLSRSVTYWPWIDLQSGNIYIAPASAAYLPYYALPAPTTAGLTLWSSSVFYNVSATLSRPSPLCAPTGAWTNDSVGFSNRNGSYAVLYTQLAMRMIGSISSVKTMMAAIPTGSTMVPTWISGAPYAPGNVVKSPADHNYYRCITPANSVWTGQMTEMAATGIPTPPPSPNSSYTSDPSGDTTNWQQLRAGETPDPILLDAWGNPILMAPAAGLINVWTNCSKSAPPIFPPPQWGGTAPTTQLQAWVNPLPGGGTPPSYCQPPIVAPDSKPFFYSAGPDGDFTAGDDNIYSFNK